MAREDEETPEVPAEERAMPTADTTLEAGAEGTTQTSEARSPEPAAPPAGESAPAQATESQEAEPEVRTYQPTEDYQVGDRIFHPVWGAVGVVRERDPREQVFRASIGKREERGRCHLIRVEFEKEVPASGGPRQVVTLIADWRGQPFEVGVPQPRPLPEPEVLLGARAEEETAVLRGGAPALPEIPEPEEELGIEEPEEQTDVEEIDRIRI